MVPLEKHHSADETGRQNLFRRIDLSIASSNKPCTLSSWPRVARPLRLWNKETG